jgi:hypothetical protein
MKPFVVGQQLEVGKRYRQESFDPLNMKSDGVVIEYLGKKPFAALGEELEAHHLRQWVAGDAFESWVNDLGEVLWEELPMGMIAMRESQTEATYGFAAARAQGGAPDIIEESAIEAQDMPPDVQAESEITYLLAGLRFEGFDLDGGRQELILHPTDPERRKLRLIPRGGNTSTPRVELTKLPESFDIWLAEEALIQAGHPSFVALAGEVAQGKTIYEAVSATSDWVYAELKKQNVIGVPSALQTLQDKVGDCNEHATLTVAILRTAGIPSRLASGIAYLDGRFFHHAWVEYWDGDWLTVDPTWGQMPADLGHIRFIIGGLDRQVELVRILGKLKIRALLEEIDP